MPWNAFLSNMLKLLEDIRYSIDKVSRDVQTWNFEVIHQYLINFETRVYIKDTFKMIHTY